MKTFYFKLNSKNRLEIWCKHQIKNYRPRKFRHEKLNFEYPYDTGFEFSGTALRKAEEICVTYIRKGIRSTVDYKTLHDHVER